MIRTIIWYFKFFFMLYFKYPELKKAERLMKNNKMDEFYKHSFEETSKWAKQRIKDSGAKIYVYGEENIPRDTNVLFISNHQSDFDIAIFMALIPTNKSFLAKSELRKIPILKTWMEYIGCIFIDRNDPKSSLNSLIQAINLLKNGKNLVIFPEGTRSKSSKMNEFKQGTFKIAIKSKAVILPVSIDGSYKLKEKNKGFIKPAEVYVHIHPPVYTENMSKEKLDTLADDIKNIIQAKLSE